MEYTKNLKLAKPSYDDDVDVNVINKNMDIIDDRIMNARNYLPLNGGTMNGNITMPFDIGLNYDANHWLNFQNTSFKGVTDTTLATKANRFKFYTPSWKEFVVQDDGVYWNGKLLLTIDDKNAMNTIQETKLSWGSGYTKLNNGLLLQWGIANTNGNDRNPTLSNARINLPLPFVDAGYCVIASKSNGNSNNYYATTYDGVTIYNITKTSFDMSTLSQVFYSNVNWFAIGKGVL